MFFPYARAISPGASMCCSVTEAPSTRMRFQKFAFSFNWKPNESIASTRSFSDRFTRPHGNDEKTENAFNILLRIQLPIHNQAS